MPKPAIPCSVSGVLKTRSLPVNDGGEGHATRGGTSARTEFLCQPHRAPEHAPKRDVLAEDDGGVVLRQRYAVGSRQGGRDEPRRRGRTSLHPGPPDTYSSCESRGQ